MWRERYRINPGMAAGIVAALVLATGCAPDGPGDGVPTHPSDTYSVTLEWDAPTTDAVGRPLQDLAGYRLYYRDSESNTRQPKSVAALVFMSSRIRTDGRSEN